MSIVSRIHKIETAYYYCFKMFIHNSPIDNERPPQEPSGPEASQVSPVRSLTKDISIIKTNRQYTSSPMQNCTL